MFHPELNMNKIEAIFRKGMDTEIDSYSGFYDNGHRKSTGLAGYLREREAKTVFVCGLAGDYCVYYTAKDAIREGFDTYILEDATKSLSSDGFKSAKEDIRRMGGSVVMSHEAGPQV
jgi:nicotinamidase/pyrazinamidase